MPFLEARWADVGFVREAELIRLAPTIDALCGLFFKSFVAA